METGEEGEKHAEEEEGTERKDVGRGEICSGMKVWIEAGRGAGKGKKGGERREHAIGVEYEKQMSRKAGE